MATAFRETCDASIVILPSTTRFISSVASIEFECRLDHDNARQSAGGAGPAIATAYSTPKAGVLQEAALMRVVPSPEVIRRIAAHPVQDALPVQPEAHAYRQSLHGDCIQTHRQTPHD